ncbi:heterokaryon incompatibility protein-domain-containing protein [Bisporella sp. PMI_857]|nr:heterokaryon incompatibility protein-domain-containing protein [Bisporella sp. PMI_857]
MLDERPFYVTTNLDSALRHMHDPLRNRRVRADAICINQADDEEKSRQVSQMAEVYRHAQNTITYLEDSTDEIGRLLNFARSSGELFSDTSESQATSLLRRSLFSRVWLYQEQLFSRDLILEARRGLGVSDPRDKLFAHLGTLSQNDRSIGLQTKSLISVDYGKSLAEVYEHIAKFYIQVMGNYIILAFIGYTATPSPIASWAPNWTVKSPPHPYIRLRDSLMTILSDFDKSIQLVVKKDQAKLGEWTISNAPHRVHSSGLRRAYLHALVYK